MKKTNTAKTQLLQHLKRRTEELDPEYIAPGEWDFTEFAFDIVGYTKQVYGFEYWSGKGTGSEGQLEIAQYYQDTLKRLHERRKYERGKPYDRSVWVPGETIKNWIRVEAGHTTGKTFLAATIVCHFFDAFRNSIGYAFAPTAQQINDLLFKEIRRFRDDKPWLPGRVLKLPEIRHRGDHFVKGKATGNSSTESVQGQHGEYLIFVLDEAEGIDPFVYDAIESMASGGIAIVLAIANPRTNTSRFHKIAGNRNVKSFRLSCLNHPNVITNKEIVTGAVKREYVNNMIEKHCEVVPEHVPDFNTFEVPWLPGEIFKPDNEFMFRVLGRSPRMQSFNTFLPTGRYELAKSRKEPVISVMQPNQARIGVDSARFGDDSGTVYVKRNDTVYRHAVLSRVDGYKYYVVVKDLIEQLVSEGVNDIQVRVDGGGGYSSTLIDNLNADDDLFKLVSNKEVEIEKEKIVGDMLVYEIHFNGVPSDPKNFADKGTEMYWHAAQACQNIAIGKVPDSLAQDLCERTYNYVTRRGISVRSLQSKDKFKQEFKRSPDDGDGFVLAAAPDELFGGEVMIGFA